jgi:ankyrin repeat protein
MTEVRAYLVTAKSSDVPPPVFNISNLPALHCAVIMGDVSLMNDLLTAGTNIDEHDCDGRTPLMWASYLRNAEAVGILCRAGACPNNYYRVTPLEIACTGASVTTDSTKLTEYKNVIKILSEAGASLPPFSHSIISPAIRELANKASRKK